ncbi:DUF4190 domain-containing protein [Streptomyces durbertensis]|uniref:DUF4190 domain-containing protein n=2 Tax=Streptomyces durbertensis TaxID=2448886 RepID=A0ABR6ENJ0_9ACTN|nr:DUF4190 domain-containing protein [Streptomyces durbertensis]
MTMGIVSGVFLGTVVLAVVCLVTGPIAWVMGARARRKVQRGEAHGSSQATTGLVLGVVTTVIPWALLILLVVLGVTGNLD